MKPARMIPMLVALSMLPAKAQTPLFLDGSAFGGSKVFSEGVSPLGNPARFDQAEPQPAVHATFVDGDQRSEDSDKVFKELGIGRSSVAVNADQLRRLSDSPWALRTRSFGVAYLSKTGNTSFTHEDHRSFFAATDRNPAGYTCADVRRSSVDRIAIGVGGMEQGTAMGFSLRLERWRMGTEALYLNPSASQLALSGGPDPFDFNDMSKKATTLALDFGCVYEVTQGVRFGGTIDRLNQKHLWDVYERPQVRLGVQVDLGSTMRISAEMDVNETQRMPFPVDQRTAAVSFRAEPNQTVNFLVGVERKEIGDVAVTSVGAVVRFRTQSFLVGLGFQFGQDRPLKGVTMVVN